MLRAMMLAGMMLAPQALAQSTGTELPLNEKEAHREFRVRYVTLDAVYFNGGTVLGVRPGDKVWVMRNGQRIAPLEVKHVSQHSASCAIDRESAPGGNFPDIKMNDAILWTIPMQEYLKRTRPPQETPANRPIAPGQKQNRTASSAPKRYPAKRRVLNNEINGQLSLQSFGQKDRSPQPFNFVESAAYLRLNVERLGGAPLRLTARMRSSQNFRQLGAGKLQQQAAVHRVYEIALAFDSPASRLDFALGRMLRHDMRGLGYLDGITLGYRFNDRWKAGVFAGVQPDLYRYEFRADEKKYGAFFQMKTLAGKSTELTLAATGIGQYMGGEVSREYLAAQADVSWSRQLYLTQYCEIDWNRNWRNTNNVGTLALSNAYFNATYYPQPRLSFGLSYDARRLIRTWETRTLADSLFDQGLRQGWRAHMALQPTALTRIALDSGWQGQQNAPAVYSAGLSASASDLWRSGFSLSARLSYFGNSQARGYYPGLDLSRRFWGMLYLTLGAGRYIYRMENPASTQRNPWERLRLDANLNRQFFLSATIENFHGDTMNFARGFVDVGWRF